MPTKEKIYNDIMNGKNDNNIKFNDMCNLLDYLGAKHRIKGDHFIFSFDGIADIVNIQPQNNKCKDYQVKQIRKLFTDNNIKL